MMDSVKQIERSFANAQAMNLPSDVYRRWHMTLSGHRFMAFKGKIIKVYNVLFGKPSVIDTLVLENATVDLDQGLKSTWKSERHGIITIGHTPHEVAEGCFLWHNFSTPFDYTRFGDRRHMRFAMSWKTMRNPKTLEEGVTFLLEKAAFDDFTWGGA